MIIRVLVSIFIYFSFALNNVFANSDCFDLGEKYEQLAKQGGEKLVENYQKAQDYYLCAAKEGNALAGLSAVGLSESGWANPLDDAEEIRLLTTAANAGIPTAALTLSSKYCDFLSCKNPQEAKIWIIKSVSLGEPVGANELGAFYEKGYEGEKNLAKAAACFKLSENLGYELGKENHRRILSQNPSLAQMDCL